MSDAALRAAFDAATDALIANLNADVMAAGTTAFSVGLDAGIAALESGVSADSPSGVARAMNPALAAEARRSVRRSGIEAAEDAVKSRDEPVGVGLFVAKHPVAAASASALLAGLAASPKIDAERYAEAYAAWILMATSLIAAVEAAADAYERNLRN